MTICSWPYLQICSMLCRFYICSLHDIWIVDRGELLRACLYAGSYMWPMVPITHMYYRMTQLARGFALNAALAGPSHIFTVLVCSFQTTPSPETVASIHEACLVCMLEAFSLGVCTYLSLYSAVVKKVIQLYRQVLLLFL